MDRVRHVVALLGGVSVGILLGLFLGWVAWPAQYAEATPQLLDDTYKQDYALMIATRYMEDRDLIAAHTYIAQLGPEGEAYIFNLMLDMILSQPDPQAIQRMVVLADALGYYSPAMQTYLPTPEATDVP